MKFTSRKFIFSLIQLILMVGLPVVYRHLEISDELCKMVLIGIFSGHIYHFANVWESKNAANINK